MGIAGASDGQRVLPVIWMLRVQASSGAQKLFFWVKELGDCPHIVFSITKLPDTLHLFIALLPFIYIMRLSRQAHAN